MRCYRSCAQKPAEQSSNASNYAGMVKAIARALRWRDMLENGTHAGIVTLTGFASKLRQFRS